MKDILTIVLKEFWELKYSAKYFLWFLVWLPIIYFIMKGEDSTFLISAQVFLLLVPALIAMAASGQIVLESILGEKKAKTLELILSTKMAPFSIIAGKILPALAVGYLLSQVSVLTLLLLGFVHISSLSYSVAFYFFFLPLLISYETCCLSAITTLLIPDPRVAPMISILILGSPILLLGRFYGQDLSKLIVFLVILGIVILSGLLTWLASLVIKKHPMRMR